MIATEQQKIDTIYYWYHRRKQNLGNYNQAVGGVNTEAMYNLSKGVFRDTSLHHRQVVHEIYWYYCLGYSASNMAKANSASLFSNGLNKKITKAAIQQMVRQCPNGCDAPTYFWDMYKSSLQSSQPSQPSQPSRSSSGGSRANVSRASSWGTRTTSNGNSRSRQAARSQSSNGGGVIKTILTMLVAAALVTYIGLPLLWQIAPSIGRMFGFKVPGGAVLVVWIALCVFAFKKR